MCRISIPGTEFAGRLVNRHVCGGMQRQCCVAEEQQKQQSKAIVTIQ